MPVTNLDEIYPPNDNGYAQIILHDPEDEIDFLDIRYDPCLKFLYVNAEEERTTYDGDTAPSVTCIRLDPGQARKLAYWLLEVTE